MPYDYVNGMCLIPPTPEEKSVDRQALLSLIQTFQMEMVGTLGGIVDDTHLIARYKEEVQKLTADVTRRVNAREMTSKQATAYLRRMKSHLRRTVRANVNSVGSIKGNPEFMKGLKSLLGKEAKKMYGKKLHMLPNWKQQRVYQSVLTKSKAVKLPKKVSMSSVGKVGRGLIIFSAAISVYNIVTAEDPLRQTGKEAITFGGSMAGGAAAGALAGLACGPGAPVCVTVGVFVGGVLGAIGSEYAFDKFF